VDAIRLATFVKYVFMQFICLCLVSSFKDLYRDIPGVVKVAVDM